MYGILWILFRTLGRIFLRYQTIGSENIPPGGVLLAANHASYTDIPLLGCGVRRRMYFLGRANLFPTATLKWVLRSMGWIPLRTDRVDRKAFGLAVNLINDGRPVVIFPEGRRTHTGHLQTGKPGLGMIVAETGCQVVPVYIKGTFEVLPIGSKRLRLHPVSVIFGKPLDFREATQVYQGKEFYSHVSRTVIARIAELGKVEQPAHPVT